MTAFETLEEKINHLLTQEDSSLSDLRAGMLEIEEFIGSEDYASLPAEERGRLQNTRKDLKARIRGLQDGDGANGGANGGNGGGNGAPAGVPAPAAQVGEAPAWGAAQPQAEGRGHNPVAEGQMEAAEKLFYSGRYAEAIKLYDRVLQIEPAWERARQHHAEAENYLRTGYIPSVALPSEAASSFGKAQSAARVGRYHDALALLQKAQASLRDLGIQRWQEGQEFEQKLQENIDAENVFEDGLEFFRQGKVDEAIDAVETASRATGLPKYGDKALELRRIKESMRSISDVLNSPSPELRAISGAKGSLDALFAEYGANPAFQRLKGRLEAVIPRVVDPLKDQVRASKAQADKSPTLEGTLYLAREAKSQLEAIRNLEAMDEGLERLQTEVDKQLREAQRLEEELQRANTVYENKKSWPAEAARISGEVRRRYPNDPEVIRLNRSLRRYHASLAGLKLLGAAGGLILIGLLGWFAFGRARAYMLSLTPTPTATGTATFTPTATGTVTPTTTGTITPTLRPSLTPTPMLGMAERTIWARGGCYEDHPALGRIPIDGEVRFMPSERRFDEFNRECVLVEYNNGFTSIIGWVLIADIQGTPE
jgi:tetratricopeptide (TPR) repeat protein